MSVRLRLKRTGRNNLPYFRICAYDPRTRRDGTPIEDLGWYDPLQKDPAKSFSFDEERMKYWLSVGALPSETVRSFIKKKGVR